VQGQYPNPYQIPRKNQEKAVKRITIRWIFRNFRQNQPDRINRIRQEWNTKKKIFSALSNGPSL